MQSLRPATLRYVFGLLFGLLASWGYGQQAALTVTDARLSSQGGYLTFTASAAYEQTPNVLGWSVKLPEGCSLVETGGPHLPEIRPLAGTINTIEWAYITVPDSPVQFEFSVFYPAGLEAPQTIAANLIIRADGQTKTIAAPPIVLRPATAPQKNRPHLQER
jgi:hypothetical protein